MECVRCHGSEVGECPRNTGDTGGMNGWFCLNCGEVFYTITVESANASGKSSSGSVDVTVPHE